MLSLLLTAWVAGQGQALEMSFPTEPGLTGITVRWSGHQVPFIPSGDKPVYCSDCFQSRRPPRSNSRY